MKKGTVGGQLCLINKEKKKDDTVTVECDVMLKIDWMYKILVWTGDG